ncbi:MAG: hypothetical protein H0V12_11615 [Chloroflexi bacterium]|nr:hypothetical protein [Chloroflexota bacterium]
MKVMTVLRVCLAGLAIVCAPSVCPGAPGDPQDFSTSAPPSQLRVFVDCQDCFQEFLRAEVTFVDYVRDRGSADVHVLITSVETGSGGREYTVAFMGQGAFAGTDRTIRTVTSLDDSEDVVRRQLANALRLGLLNYMATDGMPPHLGIAVRLESSERSGLLATDRWNHWVFSVRGAAGFEGEESSREMQLSGRLSADRITPQWKITLGSELDHETQAFDLDEDDPVEVQRRETEFNWLVVRALGEHWSIGAAGDVESSTFENIRLSVAAAPAVEYNLFPYSAYTRRQLRALYSLGVQRQQYYEPTLFGRTDETLPAHELSLTFEQRERWGSLEARAEWSQYLHELDKSRFEVDADISLRVARGLSVGLELNASRIRDQLSLPARDASPEEILLRVRRLQSGYEYEVGMSITYSFGSIFSSVINPRFGQ